MYHPLQPVVVETTLKPAIDEVKTSEEEQPYGNLSSTYTYSICIHHRNVGACSDVMLRRNLNSLSFLRLWLLTTIIIHVTDGKCNSMGLR